MAASELTGYLFKPQAEHDLAAIWRYSAETWSPDQADFYIGGLIRTIETLVAMPTLAREREEFSPPVRIHPVAEHLIVYLVQGDRLVVIRILGSRRNWRALLEMIDA
jgi:toxin ParE1/3/4